MQNANKAKEGLYAAVIGRIDLLKSWIDEGADPNTTDEDGSTPLMLAAANGHADTVAFLLENGADPSLKDTDGWTAAKLASNAGFPEISSLIEGEAGKGVSRGNKLPKEVEEIAIVSFVKERAEEIKAVLGKVTLSGGTDEEAIKEANNLNLLLFTEAYSFSKSLDPETKKSAEGILNAVNGNFEKTAEETGRTAENIDISSINVKEFSSLLEEDKDTLKGVTRGIYESITLFANDALGISPSEFTVKYGAYHKRLMKMREALLDSLRSSVGEKPKSSRNSLRIAKTIGGKE